MLFSQASKSPASTFIGTFQFTIVGGIFPQRNHSPDILARLNPIYWEGVTVVQGTIPRTIGVLSGSRDFAMADGDENISNPFCFGGDKAALE